MLIAALISVTHAAPLHACVAETPEYMLPFGVWLGMRDPQLGKQSADDPGIWFAASSDLPDPNPSFPMYVIHTSAGIVYQVTARTDPTHPNGCTRGQFRSIASHIILKDDTLSVGEMLCQREVNCKQTLRGMHDGHEISIKINSSLTNKFPSCTLTFTDETLKAQIENSALK